MQGDTVQTYTTQEIAKMTGVESVTIRKYSLALEDAGYIIRRTQTGRRIFSEKDAIVIKHMRTLLQQSGMSVENCANAVAARHNGNSQSVMDPQDNQLTTEVVQYEERYSDVYAKLELLPEIVDKLEMLEHIPTIVGQVEHVRNENADLRKQVERLTEALNHVTKQNDTMSNVMNDRDKALMEAIRNMEEIKQTQQQVAASIEEQKNAKRGWWPFGRK